MKYIIYVAAAILLAACAGRGGHNHDHDHSHESHAHTAHEGACNGHEHASHDDSDHDHATHEGHAHDCEGHDHDHGEMPDQHIDDPEDIFFSRAQAGQSGVDVEVVARGAFSEVIKVTGVVSPARGEQVNIVAPASGIVSFRGKQLTEGSRIGSGTALFSVASDRVSGGDVLALNRAAFNKAKADYERSQLLSVENIVSQAELDAARAEYESARAAYESLNDGGTGQGATVTSPIGGYIYGISVTEGDYVETGRLLATVVRDRDMELRAEVPQRLYGRLATVADANFRPQGSDAVYNVREQGGSLLSKGVGVSPGTSFIPVTFRFGYIAAIPAGSYADVNLLGGTREDVITLPLEAVTEQQGLYYVYVRTGTDVYRRREVTTGGNDGRRIEITGGLAEGETVVVKGAVNIRMASASAAIPHGHEH